MSALAADITRLRGVLRIDRVCAAAVLDRMPAFAAAGAFLDFGTGGGDVGVPHLAVGALTRGTVSGGVAEFAASEAADG